MTVSVLIDATKTGTPIGGASGTSFTDSTLTVGNNVGRVMVVFLGWSANPGTVTVTWDSGGTNQVATALPGSPYAPSGGNYCGMWAILNPTTGNKTLSVSWTNSTAYVASFGSFYNANTGSLAACFYGVQTQFQATGSTTSINVTTNQNPGNADMSLSMMTAGDASTIINPFVLQFWGPDNQTGIGALGGICYNGNAQGTGSTVNFQTSTSASAQTFAINIQAFPYNEVYEQGGTPRNIHKPTSHAALAALRQNPAGDTPPISTEAGIFVIGYDDGWPDGARIGRRLLLGSDTGAGSAIQPETNTHFIGRYHASVHFVRPGLRMAPALDPAVSFDEPTFLGRLRPPVYSRLPKLPLTDTALPQVETNPHFIAKFTAPVHFRWEPDELWSFDSSIGQLETNPHFRGRFTPSIHVLNLALRQNAATDVPVTVQPETNINFIARFVPTIHKRITASTIDTGVPQAETNVHFIGRFTAPKYARLAQTSFDTGVPQVETNTHFIGRFTAPRFSRLPYLSFDSGTPALETNPHWLGRFTPTTHFVSPLLRQTTSDLVPLGPQPETNVNSLARFSPPRHVVNPALRQTTTDIQAGPVQPETNTNFLARFTDTRFARFNYNSGPPDVTTFAPYSSILVVNFDDGWLSTPKISRLYQQPDTDIPPPPVPETNVSFVGTFEAPTHSLLALLRGGNSDVIPETNTHFIAKFTATKHTVLPALRQFAASDFSGPPPVAETNTNFIARFRAPVYARLAHSMDTNVLSTPIVETNVSFIGRFAPGAHRVLPALRQNDARDVQPLEQNPHFIGRYHAPIHARFAYNLAVEDISTNIVETNTFSIARHRPGAHHLNPALRQNTLSADQQVETNPHFIGRYTAPTHARFRYSSEWDTAVPQHETNTAFVPRFSPPVHKVRRALFQIGATDAPIIIPGDDPQNFIARHTPTTHTRFRYNSTEEAPPGAFVQETNPHFIGRFTETVHTRFAYNGIGVEEAVVFRKTFAEFGTRVGNRQKVETI